MIIIFAGLFMLPPNMPDTAVLTSHHMHWENLKGS
jgi:hypothetical protein